jgi:hypothetical protein
VQIQFNELAAVTAIGGTLFSAAWLIGRLFVNRIIEKTNLCVQLHETYFSADMVEARNVAWHTLERENITRPFKFSTFWANKENGDSVAATNRVMAFFYRLYVLDSLGKINRRLARRLFSYQYAHWRVQLKPLVQDTLRYDQDHPDLFIAFSKNNLRWLKKGAQIFNPSGDGNIGDKNKAPE